METTTVAIFDESSAHDVLSVSWDSSSICNQKCSYCDTTFRDGKHHFPSVDKVVNFLSDLEVAAGKKLYLEMKGGEPTLWKQLDEFLEICKQRQWGVGLVTNATKPLSWWQERLELFGDITFSLHPEYYDFEKVCEKLEYILPRKFINAFFLMYPPLFDKVKEDILVAAGRFPNLNMRAVIVSQPAGDNTVFDYSRDQQIFIEEINSRPRRRQEVSLPIFPFYPRYRALALSSDNVVSVLNTETVKMQKKNRWAGWMCYAGLDRIHIDVSGEIFRGQCKQGGSLGNIHTLNWVIPKTPVECKKNFCFCGHELLLKKWDKDKLSLL